MAGVVDRSREVSALVAEARKDMGLPAPVKGMKHKRRARDKRNRELEVVYQGICEMEKLLDQVKGGYTVPWPEDFPCNGMNDSERDIFEERFASFLVEMRAVSKQWKSPRSAFENDVRSMLLHRVQSLADAFRDCQRLRSRREALRQEPRLWSIAREEEDPWKKIKKNTAPKPKKQPSTKPMIDARYPPPENTHVSSAIITTSPSAQQQQQMQIERESLLNEIQAGEYDAAHRVESRMQQVSELLATFSSLTMEQHETVSSLFDTVGEVADIVDKGRDQLHRAVERKSKSTDFMTSLVLFLAVSLLFLHWIAP